MDEPSQQQRAKRYEAIHNLLFVVETVYTILLLIAFLYWAGSDILASVVQSISPNPWIHVRFMAQWSSSPRSCYFAAQQFWRLSPRTKLDSPTKAGAWAFDD